MVFLVHGQNGLLVQRHVIVEYKTEIVDVIHHIQLMVVAIVMVKYIKYNLVKLKTVQVCI